ncbi:MAG: tetratricopeptide repeat protein, partial [Cyanobacteria bacterium]|nr:tetratricopeptide repeat protein [Cyanobacteriota bacterium]
MRVRALGVVCALLLLVACGEETSTQSKCDRYWFQAQTEKNPATREKLYQQALDGSGHSKDLMQVPRLLIDYADCLVENDKPARAETLLNDAITKIKNVLRTPHMDKGQERDSIKTEARAEFVLAKALAKLDRLEAADEKFKAAIALHDRGLGTLDVKVEMLKQYVDFLKKTGKNEKAEELGIESEASMTSVDDCDKLFNTADEFMARGEMAQARHVLSVAYLAAKKFGLKSNRYRDSLVHMGRFEIASGNFARGKEVLQQAMDPKDYPENRGIGNVERTAALLGFCSEVAGDTKAAEALYSQSAKSYAVLPVEELKKIGTLLVNRKFAREGLIALKRAWSLAKLSPKLTEQASELKRKVFRLCVELKQYDEAIKITKEELKECELSGNTDGYRYYVCQLSDVLIAKDVMEDRRFLSSIVIPKKFNRHGQDLVKIVVLARLGLNYMRAGDYEECDKKEHEALTLATKLKDTSAMGVATFNLGDSARRQMKFVEAERWYREGMALWENGDNRTAYLDDMFRLSELYCEWGKIKEAKELYFKQWELLGKHQHENDPDRRATVGCRMTAISIEQKNLDSARKWLAKSMSEVKKANSTNLWYQAFGIYSKGDIAFSADNFEEALKHYKEDLKFTRENKDNLQEGLFCNCIKRFLNVGDKFLVANRVDEAVKVVDIAMNAYGEIKAGACPDLHKRLEPWIKVA